jgi:hypothetical protein
MPNFFTADELAAKRIRIEQAAQHARQLRQTHADADDLLGQAFEQAREILAGPYLRIVVEKSERWFRWCWYVFDETNIREPELLKRGMVLGRRRAERLAWAAYRSERSRIRGERRAVR